MSISLADLSQTFAMKIHIEAETWTLSGFQNIFLVETATPLFSIFSLFCGFRLMLDY